jgi:6-phosphofructokinase 1
MGYAAVHAILQGQQAHVTAFNKGEIDIVPLTQCLGKKTEDTTPQLELIRALAI